jgi:hypothetical protein
MWIIKVSVLVICKKKFEMTIYCGIYHIVLVQYAYRFVVSPIKYLIVKEVQKGVKPFVNQSFF